MPTIARFLGTVALVLVAPATAAAATVTWPDGKSEAFAMSREVTGPAVVTSTDGKDTIRLQPGAVLRYLGEDKDDKGRSSESFFLKSGAARADIGFFTRLATPSYWAFPESRDKRAVFSAVVFPKDGDLRWCHAREESGSGLVRLAFGAHDSGNREFHLLASQGVLLALDGSAAIRFTTDADNSRSRRGIRLLYSFSRSRWLDAYVPAGTEGALSFAKDGSVLATCGLGSDRFEEILLVSVVDGKPITKWALSPGQAAHADPEKGLRAAEDREVEPLVASLNLLPVAAPMPSGGWPLEGGGRILKLTVGEKPSADNVAPTASLVVRNDAGDSCSGEMAYFEGTDPGRTDLQFMPFEVRGLKPGEERTISLPLPFARWSTTLELRPVPPGLATTAATLAKGALLGHQVLVREVESDVTAEKPWIRFTLQTSESAELENLRYELVFRRGGKAIARVPEGVSLRPVKSGLKAVGNQFTLTVEDLPAPGELAGALPVLRLVR